VIELKRLGITADSLTIPNIYEDNPKRLRLIYWLENPGDLYVVFHRPNVLYKRRPEPTPFGGAFVDACTNPKGRKVDG